MIVITNANNISPHNTMPCKFNGDLRANHCPTGAQQHTC